MSVVTFGGSGSVIPQLKRGRSQLATNRLLIDLGRIYGRRAFTSRVVSNGFGLDFLNTCKMLSRMSKRPYYLLSAVHVSRPYGGYENSYSISVRGWSRISYLQGQSAPVGERAGGNPLWPTRYLVNGKGEENDLRENCCFEMLDSMWPSSPSPLDETGLLLVSFDYRFLSLELFNNHAISPQDEHLRTTNRAKHLQHLGLIPKDVNVPVFVLNAYTRGSSASTILLALLMRGGIKLLDQCNSMKVTSKLDCEDYNRYKIQLEEERRTNKLLKLGKDSVQEKYEAALLENSRLKNQNNRLAHLIVGNNQCLLALSNRLKEFEDSSISVTSIKSYTRQTLAKIGIMNYLILSSEDN